MYQEECIDLLRRLLELGSRESSLRFRLPQLVEEARVGTIRLSVLIAICRASGWGVLRLRNKGLSCYGVLGAVYAGGLSRATAPYTCLSPWVRLSMPRPFSMRMS